MPNSIRLKKSGVAGKAPLVTDLSASELSYNYADGILYGKRTSGGVENVVEFAGSENHHLMKHLAAPGAPASGYLRFYAKSDNKLYTYNSIGQEHQIIAGLFSGVDEGHTLVYTESQWRSTDWIRLRQSGGYNTVEITSKESIDEFGNSQIYMSAEEGVFIHTNISKPGSASVSFTRYGITSSLLFGTGERFLVADADGTIKVASAQPTQFWQLNGGIISPINNAYHLSLNENNFWAGNGFFIQESGAMIGMSSYRLLNGNQTYLQSGTRVGRIDFLASMGTNGLFQQVASLRAIAEGHHAEKDYPTGLQFYTMPSMAGDPELRMTINSLGHVIVNKGMTVNSEYGSSYFVVSGYGSSSAPNAFMVVNNRVSVGHAAGAGDSSFNVNGAISVKSRYITTSNQTLGEEYMVYMAVAGATSLYCPSASSSMDRLYFVANGSANAVILRVQSGDYLNGTLNGTYTIKSQGLTIVHQGRSIGSTRWYAYELR